MKLTSQNVNTVLRECLFKEGEDTSTAAIAEGVISKFRFNSYRLAEKSPEIAEMLSELPDDFHSDKGGGMSFLNACVDRNGDQWGGHSSIDELLCLGIATGQAAILFPREMWSVFPGGMPYFSVSPKLQPAA